MNQPIGTTNQPDWRKASKQQLLERLLPALEENERLRESVQRLMRRSASRHGVRNAGRDDDFVPMGWAEQHGIDIPRADGCFESPVAWVRISHGVITNAGLKNQSLLSVMISRKLLDEGADHAASLYADWRAAFFSRVEATRYSDVGAGDPEAWSKEDRFSKLIHAVDRKTLGWIDTIVTSRPKEKDLNRLKDNPAPFVRAFELVASAIFRINRDADDYLQARKRGDVIAERVTAAAINGSEIACL